MTNPRRTTSAYDEAQEPSTLLLTTNRRRRRFKVVYRTWVIRRRYSGGSGPLRWRTDDSSSNFFSILDSLELETVL